MLGDCVRAPGLNRGVTILESVLDLEVRKSEHRLYDQLAVVNQDPCWREKELCVGDV